MQPRCQTQTRGRGQSAQDGVQDGHLEPRTSPSTPNAAVPKRGVWRGEMTPPMSGTRQSPDEHSPIRVSRTEVTSRVSRLTSHRSFSWVAPARSLVLWLLELSQIPTWPRPRGALGWHLR